MIDQSILHLMVKSSLLYVIHNRSYSHLKNVPEREHCRFWIKKCYNLIFSESLSVMLVLKNNLQSLHYIFYFARI